MKTYDGIGVSNGVAIAPAYVVKRNDPPVSKKAINPNEINDEINRFKRALILTKEQLERAKNIISKNMGTEQAQLLDSQIMLLSDSSIVNQTISLIKERNLNATYIFSEIINNYLAQANLVEDSFFRERMLEFNDIKRRVISNLLGYKHEFVIEQQESRILVIDHLSPSETAQLLGSNYKGIVCEVGGETSHIAIMARTMEIPAVLGVPNITSDINPNEQVIVDGNEGVVYASPDVDTIETHLEKIDEIKKVQEILLKELDLPAVTPDGFSIKVASNIELPDEVKIMRKYRSQGIGLFRTELLYINGSEFPPEHLQEKIYRKVISACEGEQVIIRTFDIGGDKFSDKFEHHLEPNPFLGWRAIRIGLDYPHLLKSQLRAILKASDSGKCAILLPMISNLKEVLDSKKIIDDAKKELRKEGVSFDEDIQIGIMVEVPSAALMANKIAPHVDFFSIGTNDLIQYTLAADRGNEKVSKYYQTYNPAVLELIKRTIDAGHEAGIWVGMCGEMAGKTLANPLLIGLGIDEISVNPSQIPRVRGMIRRTKYSDAKEIANIALKLGTHEEVQNYLRMAIDNLMPKEVAKFI